MSGIPPHGETQRENLEGDLARFGLYREIYDTRADDYERIRSCRDHEQRILPALEAIRPLAGLDVVESGAGSGHLTVMLAPLVRSIRAFDISQPMLDIATAKLSRLPRRNWHVGVADHRNLPVDDGSADVVLAGYSLCHLVDENLETWPDEVAKALAEMNRILRPTGTIMLLESLGRGSGTPRPAAHLVEYLQHLEEARGFAARRIRTDYQFPSLVFVDTVVREVFGDDVVAGLVREQTVVLPAWTGILWRGASAIAPIR
jgi:ubiquinone/menaquinone biosynthesis C-methylase UbiE